MTTIGAGDAHRGDFTGPPVPHTPSHGGGFQRLINPADVMLVEDQAHPVMGPAVVPMPEDTSYQGYLNREFPRNEFQKVLHRFYDNYLNPLLDSPKAARLNALIDSNGLGRWYEQLGTYLAKLPVRAVRNVLRLVYCILKAAIYTFIHPLKALGYLFEFLAKFIVALSKPEVLTKIGSGMIGAALGQLVTTGSPHAIVGLAVGGGILLFSLIAGAIKAAYKAEHKKGVAAAADALWNQAKTIPESLLTGFLIGAMFGAIQKSLQKPVEQVSYKLPKDIDQAGAEQYVRDHFLPEHNISVPPSSVQYDPTTGEINLIWNHDKYQALMNSNPDFLPSHNIMGEHPLDPNIRAETDALYLNHPDSMFKISIEHPSVHLTHTDVFEGQTNAWSLIPSEQDSFGVGWAGVNYPTYSLPTVLSPIGPAVPMYGLVISNEAIVPKQGE